MTRRKHSKPDSIWLFDYNSLLALDDCPKWFVLLSERDLNIIWQSTLNIDRFRSRVFTDTDGLYYTIADLDQFGNFKEWVSDMNVNMGDYMACNELLERMTLALEALAQKGCCPTGSPGSGVFNSGSRGAGITPEPANPYSQSGTPGDPPNGFDNYSQYQTHKCNAAADIVLNFKVDLLSFSNLIPDDSTFTEIMALIVGVLLTPIPYDDLATLIGLLTIGAFEYSLLATLSAEVQSNAESLICTLFNSDNAEDAQANFRAEIADLIEGVTVVELAQQWLNDIAARMTPMDVFNNLFTPGPTTSQDTDCSECTPGLVEISDLGGGGFCFASLVSGSLSGTFVMSSCDGSNVIGEDRDMAAIRTTETGVGRNITVTDVDNLSGGVIVSWTATTGYVGAFTFNPATDLIGEDFNDMTDWTICSVTPGHGNNFNVEITVNP